MARRTEDLMENPERLARPEVQALTPYQSARRIVAAAVAHLARRHIVPGIGIAQRIHFAVADSDAVPHAAERNGSHILSRSHAATHFHRKTIYLIGSDNAVFAEFRRIMAAFHPNDALF